MISVADTFNGNQSSESFSSPPSASPAVTRPFNSLLTTSTASLQLSLVNLLYSNKGKR